MPELAAPPTARLVPLQFTPVASPVNPNLQYSKPVIDTSALSNAQAISGIAQAISQLPQTLLKSYQQGRQLRTDTLARDSIDSRLAAGDMSGMSVSMGPNGTTVTSDPLTSMKIGAYKQGMTNYQRALDSALGGGSGGGGGGTTGGTGGGGSAPTGWQEPDLPTGAAAGPGPNQVGGPTQDPGAARSDANLPLRYNMDHDSGALVAQGSQFGGKKDALAYTLVKQPDGSMAKQYSDNGLFADGTSSVLVADDKAKPVAGLPAGYRYAGPQDIAALRDNPADPRFMDNPEPYVALPHAMYASGAVKPGDTVQMSTANPDGSLNWVNGIARDVGPSGNLGPKHMRGFDASPTVFSALKTDTDQPVNLYFPDQAKAQQAIANTSGLKRPSQPMAMGAPTPNGTAQGATVAPNGVTIPPSPEVAAGSAVAAGAAPARGSHVDAAGNVWMPNSSTGGWTVMHPPQPGEMPHTTEMPPRPGQAAALVYPNLQAAISAGVDPTKAIRNADGSVSGTPQPGVIFPNAQAAITAGYDTGKAKVLDQSGRVLITEGKMMMPTPAQWEKGKWLDVNIAGMNQTQAGQAIQDAQTSMGKLSQSQFEAVNALMGKMAQNPIIVQGAKQSAAYADVQQGASINNPAGDVAIIDGYARLLNPNASVSHDAQQVIQTSLPLIARSFNLPMQRIFDGGQLTPEGRQMILGAATQIHGKVEANMTRAIGGYAMSPMAAGLPLDALQRAAKATYLLDDAQPPAGGAPAPAGTAPNPAAAASAAGTAPAGKAATPAPAAKAGAPAAPGTNAMQPVKVTTKAQYDALPPGTSYIDSKGNPGVKPT